MANANVKAANLIRNALASVMLCGVTQAAAAMPFTVMPFAASTAPAASTRVETISLKKVHHYAHRRVSTRERAASDEIGRDRTRDLYDRGHLSQGPIGPYGYAVDTNGELHIPYTLSR
jgi:hypothetical protein